MGERKRKRKTVRRAGRRAREAKPAKLSRAELGEPIVYRAVKPLPDDGAREWEGHATALWLSDGRGASQDRATATSARDLARLANRLLWGGRPVLTAVDALEAASLAGLECSAACSLVYMREDFLRPMRRLAEPRRRRR
jgi:hypothetical protein